MAATTISDLPQDALVLILRAVIDAAGLGAPDEARAREIHQNLRCVSREWRDAVDIAFIEYLKNDIKLVFQDVRNPATVRARFPSLIHGLLVDFGPAYPPASGCRAPITAQALSSLCASPDLRRVLKRATLDFMRCGDEAAAAMSAIAVCPHLTYVKFEWQDQKHDHGSRPDVLEALTTLTGLKELAMVNCEKHVGRKHVWPRLPNVTTLTSIHLDADNTTFAVMGSDATLGGLRRMSMWNTVGFAHGDGWVSDDPFRLRADLDAGLWRPHLLTRMQELYISMLCNEEDHFDDWVAHQFDGAAPAAAVWAPLAPTVTKLELACQFAIFHDSDLETGMYAGLGVLTGLQSLTVKGQYDPRSLVDFGRVRLPHLTKLFVRGHRGPPIDLARFPRLAHVEIETAEPEPLMLSSVAALRRLASLRVSGWPRHEWPLAPTLNEPNELVYKPDINLAEMFGGGRPLAALTGLSFDCVTLSWDVDEVVGVRAPATAAEFAAGAAALLPSLWSVEIKENVVIEEDVREFVVPAVRALAGG